MLPAGSHARHYSGRECVNWWIYNLSQMARAFHNYHHWSGIAMAFVPLAWFLIGMSQGLVYPRELFVDIWTEKNTTNSIKCHLSEAFSVNSNPKSFAICCNTDRACPSPFFLRRVMRD